MILAADGRLLRRLHMLLGVLGTQALSSEPMSPLGTDRRDHCFYIGPEQTLCSVLHEASCIESVEVDLAVTMAILDQWGEV